MVKQTSRFREQLALSAPASSGLLLPSLPLCGAPPFLSLSIYLLLLLMVSGQLADWLGRGMGWDERREASKKERKGAVVGGGWGWGRHLLTQLVTGYTDWPRAEASKHCKGERIVVFRLPACYCRRGGKLVHAGPPRNILPLQLQLGGERMEVLL